MPRVEVDLVEPKDKREILKFEITFPFDPKWVAAIQTIPGWKFVQASKSQCGGSAWQIPADMANGKLLREKFGDNLHLLPAVKAWGREKVTRGRTLSKLALADTATLTRLPARLPGLHAALHVGPRGATMSGEEFGRAFKEDPGSFQLADVAFMAHALGEEGVNCVNANQPGMGKTMEAIGAVFEAGLDEGPQLVVAPVTSLEVVWAYELGRWQDHKVIVASENKKQREAAIEQAFLWYQWDTPFWFICSPGMIQYRKRKVKVKGQMVEEEYILYPQVSKIKWKTVTLDEFHKMGLSNPATGTARAVNKLLQSTGRDGLCGTPLGGKPERLFGILHWLDPEEFSSKWRFAGQWLDVTETTYQKRGEAAGEMGHGKKIGGIKESRRAEFDLMLSQYLTRRTKDECLPWLPPKQFRDIWAKMDAKQAAQYEQFAEEAEIRIDEEHLSAASILAEYTRLKQFSNSVCTIPGLDPKTGRPIVMPTEISCKLPHVMALLDERGIRSRFENIGDEQVVIFSQFSKFVDVICDHLQKSGIAAEKITGKITAKRRADLVRSFQSGKVRVMVMTTTAGGVSITLDKANTVIVLDETWNPDDQEQAVDRIHRGAKTAQVMCYTIRTRGTIEEYVQQVNTEKAGINYEILDLRRKGLRATGVAKPGHKRVK